MEESRPRADPTSVSFEMAPICVQSETLKVQLCPALALQSPHAIPVAVKNVYSRLAAAATELDEGIASLLLVLVSEGNSWSGSLTKNLGNALSKIVGRAPLWLLSSGRADDPLATIASQAIRHVLPQIENDCEVLHVGVNAYSIIFDESIQRGPMENPATMVDVGVNTLLVLCKDLEDEIELAKYRANFAVRLSQPPPALLIGVPTDGNPNQMPSATSPILLSPGVDSRPLPVIFFAAQSANSLEELFVYIEHGLPVIVLQDSCELCDTLYNAYLLYKSAEFNHQKFISWLERKFPGSQDIKRTLQIAACLDLPSVLDTVEPGAIDEESMSNLLVSSVSRADRLDFLACLLSRPEVITLTEDLLLKILNSGDQHFFNTIVLCQCLGHSSNLTDMDQRFCRALDNLLIRFSHGTRNLFPHGLHPPLTGLPAVQILAIWCLLLNRPQQVKCFIAHTEQPLATSLVLSRMARSLSNEAYDWFFYADSLRELSADLSKNAEDLLHSVHLKSPTRSYQVLCEPIEAFGNVPLTEIAYKADNRDFLAHESCQRWVYRLLYANLQVRSGAFPSFLPKWIKLVFAAFFIFPLRFWVALRPSSSIQQKEKRNMMSPTVALLDVMRQPKKTRALSAHSIISTRSDALSTITSMNIHHNQPLLYAMPNGGDSTTPQSMILPFSIEEMDTGPPPRPQKKHRDSFRKRRWRTPTLNSFYRTPIVKFWVSLVFRLIHISVFSYSILLPGCGSNILDMVVWVWTLISTIEQAYVLWKRTSSVPFTEMPWRIFDIIVVIFYLVGVFMLKLFGENLSALGVTFSVYPSRVISAFYLLYFCYSTLFTYIPLSELFGPMVVRVKLMLLRDFTHFLVLVALVMLSSAVAVHSLLYPDLPLSMGPLLKSLNWAWLSIFTTDMSALQESERCKKVFLGPPQTFCNAVGMHRDATCPRQGTAAYVAIIEYFIILKLILWPILFAFFAKTAKSVDEEADRIWKHQMYALVTEFGLRPCLPPPFTPFLLIFGSASGCLRRCTSAKAADHPDMVKMDGPASKKYSMYRNPSVPFKRFEFLNAFWRETAISKWRANHKAKNNDGERKEDLSELRRIRAQLRKINLSADYERESAIVQAIRKTAYEGSAIYRLVLPESLKNWDILFPSYSPPFYNKPAEEFIFDLQKWVEVTTRQYTTELRRVWRSKQLNDPKIRLSSLGFPLNPAGRTGISGRGQHVRFGPNPLVYYVVFRGAKGEAQVLLQNGKLPHEWRFETGIRDEKLTSILIQVGINDSDAQMLSTRRFDNGLSTPSDTGPNMIQNGIAPSTIDTDHAWTEHDVWALSLRSRRISPTTALGMEWVPINTTTPSHMETAWIRKAREHFSL
ncbi:unnamed protein product, partial [Mesorhabditis spiculigera]